MLHESALRSDSLKVDSIVNNTLAASCWDSLPIVFNLKEAAEGKCEIRKRDIGLTPNMVSRNKRPHKSPSHFQATAYSTKCTN